MSNPCKICELYSVGEKCDNEEKYPVAQMKKENARMKRRLNKLEAEKAWGPPDCIGNRHEMGAW